MLTPRLICWQWSWGWTCRWRHLSLSVSRWSECLSFRYSQMRYRQVRGAQAAIQLTLWATSSASNLYSTAECSQVLELAHPHCGIVSVLPGTILAWASSILPDTVQTQFGPEAMPNTQFGSNHFVLKGGSMTVWTYALSTSWSLIPWQIWCRTCRQLSPLEWQLEALQGTHQHGALVFGQLNPIPSHCRPPPIGTSLADQELGAKGQEQWLLLRDASCHQAASLPSSAVFPGVSSCKISVLIV